MPQAILLAEDNEDDVFFFKAAAKRLGLTHPIEVAPDGRAAIARLTQYLEEEASNRLALVLLDLKMPFVGGLEVLEWARARAELRFVPICVLSSSEQESDIEMAYRLGAAAFLVKPSNPEELNELLQSLDAFWLRRNRLPAARLNRAGEMPAAT